nr:DUF882 domain-containing protein [Hyphomicrobium methylovorum]
MNADSITAAGGTNDRTISFYHIHTQERLTVTYKRNGKFDPSALKQINYIMRDWRKNEVKEISPETIDLAWEMHQELGSKEAISIICGYRSAATNNMLRKTRGGQASQSQHITGKAIDITFPDVPLKRMRYSALVRERGGVGYYPTSGIPFVHIDTSRVRMWPRMPRYELALLFPNGRSKFVPDDGKPINPGDVKVAQSKYRELATQVASYMRERITPGSRTVVASVGIGSSKSRMVASLGGSERRNIKLTTEPDPPKQRIAKEEAKPFAPATVAALSEQTSNRPSPRLVSAPRSVEHGSRFDASPSKSDRGKLDALVAAATSTPMPELIAGPKLAVRPQKALAAAALAENKPTPARAPAARVASLDPAAAVTGIESLSDGWAQAPEFDEDHPEELAYRPFPLAPLLTDASTSADAPLADMQRPDVAATLESLDDAGSVIPMRLRPGKQLAEAMWSQQFQGKAVHVEALVEIEQNRVPTGLATRRVLTSAR